MSVFNQIQSGYKIGQDQPIVSGIEDWLYVFNENDFTLVFDPTNPLIIIGLRSVNGGKLWKFTGTNNSFTTSSKLVKTAVGPRYQEEIDWNIAGNSVAIKTMIQAAGFGRVRAIVVNNYKEGDSAIELFGANNGMIITDGERNSSDETIEGGWKLKLGAPDKLREPYSPRAISIPVSPVGVAGSVPTVGTGRQTTAVPTGPTAVPSAGGSLSTGVQLFYKIVSVDAQGTTVGSAEVTATPSGSNLSVTLNWTAAPGATSYKVYKGTVTNTENVFFTTTSLTYIDTGAAGTSGAIPTVATSYVATATPSGVTATAAAGGGLANQAWYYKVTAIDAVGETVGSNEATATTSGSNNAVTVAWSAITGAVSYNVYRGPSASGENIFFNTTALSFTDNGINLPATYKNTLAIIEGFVGNP